MAKFSSEDLGTKSISKLLIRQSLPASIGILVMSLNILVDTIFVGNWIGSIAIAAINVVLPVSFFIAALGMAIGIGGSSIISRALGANNKKRALKTFGNQITVTLLLTVSMVILGLVFINDLIPAFGGKGDIFEPAKIYYKIVLYGVPILALSMMGNNVIRAEGKPKFAMIAMIIPSVGNLVLDYVFINLLDMGMYGAGLATTVSYVLCFAYILYFFLSKHSENNILFDLGGESSVAVYAIIGRMLMFALFPVLGVTQGFLPIAGYNYGAYKFPRVRESINTAILYAGVLGLFVFAFIMIFPTEIVSVFTDDERVLTDTPTAMRIVFMAVPIIGIQLIGSAYFQAIGKAIPALLLTLTRQGFFFIPLVLILPNYFGEIGVWISFPIADVLSTIVTGIFLNREIRTKLIGAKTATL